MIIAPEPRPDKTLPAIRQALTHPRDIEGFDVSLPEVVERARAEGDWRLVEEFTHSWWFIACVSMQDPGERQRMWDTADEIQAKIDRGEKLPGRPFDEVIAEIAAKRGIELPTLAEIHDRRRSQPDG